MMMDPHVLIIAGSSICFALAGIAARALGPPREDEDAIEWCGGPERSGPFRMSGL